MTISESDLMDIIAARAKEQSTDEYWRRLFTRSEDSIDFAARLSAEEIDAYTRAIWYAKAFGQDWLYDLVVRRLAMSASLRGKARDEAVKAITGGMEQRVRTLMRLKKVE